MIDMSLESIFRAYDVRGVYGKDLTEDVMFGIGNAVGRFLDTDIVVGRDGRLSSESLQDAFVKGFINTGRNVTDVGMLPLSVGMLYAWKSKRPFAYITASHLSKEWNGVKFFHSSGIGFLEEDNKKIKELVLDEGVVEKEEKGRIVQKNREEVLRCYEDFLLSKVKAERRIKVVLDCGNGSTGIIARRLFEDGGFDVEVLFEDVDGNFPNRGPEPSADSLTELREHSRNADIGIAYDGDGDRMTVVDDRGNVLTPEQVSYFILSELLPKEKGPVVVNVEFTKGIDLIAERFGRKVIRVRVGHTFLMEAVHKYRACFGSESSGHAVLPSLVPFDDTLAISFYFACLLSRRTEKLSKIVEGIPEYPFERVNFDLGTDERKIRVMDRIKERLMKEFSDINTLDGIRVDLKSGWVLIRPSNTSPLIRLTVEADTEEELKRLKSMFSKIVREEMEGSA